MLNLRYVVVRLIDFYELLIVAQCIMSWLPLQGIGRDIYEALERLTEPFVGLFRRAIPSVGGSGMRIDFSPMIAILVLGLLQRLILTF